MSFYILFMCNFYWGYPDCNTVIFPSKIQCEHSAKMVAKRGYGGKSLWCQEVVK